MPSAVQTRVSAHAVTGPWLRLLATVVLTVAVLSACKPASDPSATASPASAPAMSATTVTGTDDAAAAPRAGDRVGEMPPDPRPPDADASTLEPGEDLDAALAALPPVRTGPMAGSDRSGGNDDPWLSEIRSERRAQLDLPMARGPVWDVLRQTRIGLNQQTQFYTAAHPQAVRALAGREITVRGYMLPLDSNDRTAHFLISPYTPVCFFHPPAEPNEIIEVRLKRPIEAGYHLVEVSGRLQLANDGEMGLFFVLNDAAGRIVERVD